MRYEYETPYLKRDSIFQCILRMYRDTSDIADMLILRIGVIAFTTMHAEKSQYYVCNYKIITGRNDIDIKLSFCKDYLLL